MADLIKIKAGSGEVPRLAERELGYRIDEKALYIGTSNGNVKICDAKTLTQIQGLASKTYVDGLIEEINTKIAEINARLDSIAISSE